jgi:hypothetical protein
MGKILSDPYLRPTSNHIRAPIIPTEGAMLGRSKLIFYKRLKYELFITEQIGRDLTAVNDGLAGQAGDIRTGTAS